MKISVNNLLVFLSSILIIYVIYIPLFGNSNGSVALFFLILIGLFDLIIFNELFKYKGITIFILFSISLLIPIIYSVDKEQGISCFVKNLFTILIMYAGAFIYKYDRKEKFLKKIVIYALPVGVTNIIFIFFNTWEKMFYEKTNIAKLLVAPSSLASIESSNVRDPLKAGVMFINTNNASVFFVVLLIISFILYIKTNERKYLVITSIYLLAEICTGCRTGILTLIIMILFVLFIVNKRKPFKIIWVIVCTIALAIFIYSLHFEVIDNIINRLSRTSIMKDPRVIIWGQALKNMKLFGTGFGGWNKISAYLAEGLKNMPQHNHLLILVYWGGILSVILYLVFWGYIILKGLQLYKNNNIYGMILSLISIDVLVHGMFDNYFLQNMNILIFVFTIIGYLLSYNLKIKKSKDY